PPTTPPPSHASIFPHGTIHPPPPTLFPSPTLFRSPSRAVRASVGKPTRRSVHRAASSPARAPGAEAGLARRSAKRGGGLVVGGEDRKSTRLNSSHVAISYAVFCLKKKKKRMNDMRC